ncbi:hypothetical protein HB364_29925 [Pseudoflavitalea sp. X16]|uniref:hypothetical protein n=1 Tax=Paraflavitalea devenefica TaxID=2716334 RepID=UPI001420FB84|nr:hypothetical protein [Paraflavitalea devenefica]NII29336.1 hypothetical protein [Paraflavitalea devenefica]
MHQDSPTPAYDPYENRSTTRQVNRQQAIPSHFSSPFSSAIVPKPDYSLIKTNVMIFYFLHPAGNHLHHPSDEHKLVRLHEPPHNTNEGSEFLDDALRMDDEPVVYTEESIAAGSPENLL